MPVLLNGRKGAPAGLAPGVAGGPLLGIYARNDCHGWITNYAFVGAEGSFAGRLPNQRIAEIFKDYNAAASDGVLVFLGRVPDVWSLDIRGYMEKGLDYEGNHVGVKLGVLKEDMAYPVGHIAYQLFYREGHPILAETSSYKPRAMIGMKPAPGMARMIEWATTLNLKQNGVQEISTSLTPNYRRVKQLREVGLPICTPVKIDEWLDRIEESMKGHSDPSIEALISAHRA